MVKSDVQLLVDDLTKYYRTPYPLEATLQDTTGKPLVGKTIVFTINGVSYNRSTNAVGYCKLDINLPPSTYSATVSFNGDTDYNSDSRTVTVTVDSRYFNINAPYLVKDYGDAKALTVRVTELNTDTPVNGKSLSITINGVTYNRTTNSNGEATLNINLRTGEYNYTVNVPSDEGSPSASRSNKVKVMASTTMDAIDVYKYEDELKVYQCAVYDPFGRVDCDVYITVNGVTYIRHTGSDGLAKLNIRLGAGEYNITAEFKGDNLHHGSSITKRVVSKKRIQELTTRTDGLDVPGDNTGFMESHIHCFRLRVDLAKEKNIKVLNPTLNDLTGTEKHYDITFTNYEITETDPRVKTAKFTTDHYMDLTSGRYWVFIVSPYHENFGGQILKVEYDKDKGLYTYQCQDGRRQYQTKIRDVGDTTHSVYEYLEKWLVFPAMIGGSVPVPLSKEIRDNATCKTLLSGLHPLDDYKGLTSGIVKWDNQFDVKFEFLSYDSLMDNIMNFSHVGGFPTDVYFTMDGVCHIDPVHFDAWLKTGFKLTHPDLQQYKYGFDTTNIISAVGIKSPTESKWYGDGSLQWYVGYVNALIDPVTTQTASTESTGGTSGSSSSSSSSGTGSLKGKPVVLAVDTNTGQDSNYLNTAINKLQSAGYSVENLGIGPGAFSRYDWSGRSKGKVGVFIIAASTVAVADAMSHQGFDYCIFGIRGDIPGTRAITGWNTVKWGRDSDCTSVCNKWAGHTSQEISDMMGSHGCLVPGNNPTEMANNILAALNGNKVTPSSSGTSTSSDTSEASTSTTTTTVVDEVATEQKAIEKMAESVRGLLSFEIKLPLNHPMFKELHTNMMLWTELPREFQLGRLSEIFKILPTYKVNRGVSYMENRWYIEKNVVKCDSNGLFATLTLNPFPSSYSVYSNAVKGYLDAYNQAYRQQEAQTTGTTTGTGTISGTTGVTELDNLIKGWIAGKTTQYDIANAVHQGLKEYVRYASYSCSRYGTVAKCWANVRHINCADISRLTRACMSTAGLEARVVHHSGCSLGHFWTQVKIDGKWVNSDLVGAEGAKSWRNLGDVWCTSSYDRVCGDNPSC